MIIGEIQKASKSEGRHSLILVSQVSREVNRFRAIEFDLTYITPIRQPESPCQLDFLHVKHRKPMRDCTGEACTRMSQLE